MYINDKSILQTHSEYRLLTDYVLVFMTFGMNFYVTDVLQIFYNADDNHYRHHDDSRAVIKA